MARISTQARPFTRQLLPITANEVCPTPYCRGVSFHFPTGPLMLLASQMFLLLQQMDEIEPDDQMTAAEIIKNLLMT